MENMLKKLFDYQCFEQSDRLSKLIKETESRMENELSDDDLAFVAAAGEAELQETSDPAGLA